MSEPELRYIIELNARDYADLLRLVMRFGTSIDLNGIGTSVDLRRNLTEVTYRTVPTVDPVQ